MRRLFASNYALSGYANPVPGASPLEVRRDLKMKQGDKIAFILDGHEVRLARRERVAQVTAGILKHYTRHARTAEELRAEAEQAIAEEGMERS